MRAALVGLLAVGSLIVGMFVIVGPPADEAVHRACVAKALAEKPAATIDDRVEVSRACYREQGRLVPSASVYEAMERVDQAFWAAARRVTGVFR